MLSQSHGEAGCRWPWIGDGMRDEMAWAMGEMGEGDGFTF